MTVDVPGRGVRLLLSDVGDVVGVEVPGWSQRTENPSDIALSVAGVADVLDEDDPLAQALAAAHSSAGSVSPLGRPVDQRGQVMITIREACEITGRERSWLTRQLNAGKLRGRKVGNEWWTTRAWCEDYLSGRRPVTVRVRGCEARVGHLAIGSPDAAFAAGSALLPLPCCKKLR